ncbi:hypothetical protein [Lysinibacillus sp. BW-2-10]|uniref:hypothetical protein n=1 Tax=Lysinibacillus sp. BW-2-10 TaxID=2590030 RepID=UPI00117E0643|nr:hypothetical protein [Lysinibacillus sp. BW-2-10]TSI05278.1 hypothetical protein FJQ64_13305 [Lysinibacillus sp. BW-2-10]
MSEYLQEIVEFERHLLKFLQAHQEELQSLYKQSSDVWIGKEAVYRLYHQSFKVYNIQKWSQDVLELLEQVSKEPFHPILREMIRNGTNQTFETTYNSMWYTKAKPIVDLFLHLRFYVEVALDEIQKTDKERFGSPSWYLLLYLWNMQ